MAEADGVGIDVGADGDSALMKGVDMSQGVAEEKDARGSMVSREAGVSALL